MAAIKTTPEYYLKLGPYFFHILPYSCFSNNHMFQSCTRIFVSVFKRGCKLLGLCRVGVKARGTRYLISCL